jgi:hypothetical protein
MPTVSVIPFRRLTALLVLVSAAGCGLSIDFDAGTPGSRNIRTESRTISSFDKVRIGGHFDVDITVGESASLTITGDDNLLPLVRTDVRGQTLHIDKREKIRPSRDIQISVTVPSLESVTVGGSSDVIVSGVESPSFETGVSGSADVTVDGDFGDLKASVSGSGEIVMRGTADDVDVHVSGSGEVDLINVPARTGKVAVSGSGDVTLNLSEELDATVSGSGDVMYRGAPRVRSHISGSGSIHRI